jgi:hypothetical protein
MAFIVIHKLALVKGCCNTLNIAYLEGTSWPVSWIKRRSKFLAKNVAARLGKLSLG